MSKNSIKSRKKQLIKEAVLNSQIASAGRKRVMLSIIIIMSVRLLYLIFECIYHAVLGADMSVLWIELSIFPLALILFMMYDGNKALAYITMFTAAGRMIYHFTVIHPVLPTEGVTPYTIIAMMVFEIQFGFSIFMTASTKCDLYFSSMQKINIKLRTEMQRKN